jgi:hypothetical protein
MFSLEMFWCSILLQTEYITEHSIGNVMPNTTYIGAQYCKLMLLTGKELIAT